VRERVTHVRRLGGRLGPRLRVAGRRDKDYYKLADQWLRGEVEASRLQSVDPLRSAELLVNAHRARDALQVLGAA
jgi:hypothetical protein